MTGLIHARGLQAVLYAGARPPVVAQCGVKTTSWIAGQERAQMNHGFPPPHDLPENPRWCPKCWPK